MEGCLAVPVIYEIFEERPRDAASTVHRLEGEVALLFDLQLEFLESLRNLRYRSVTILGLKGEQDETIKKNAGRIKMKCTSA